jgi:hypothetical protein
MKLPIKKKGARAKRLWRVSWLKVQLTFFFVSASNPAIESPAGANSAGTSNDARMEIHTQAALQSTDFNGT